MDNFLRNLLMGPLSVNIKYYESSHKKRIPRSVFSDFNENYRDIMSVFSTIYTVIESPAPNLDGESIELSSAISASIAYLFGNLDHNPLEAGNINQTVYSSNSLIPGTPQYNTFYEYVSLIIKSSRKHNKRLGIK